MIVCAFCGRENDTGTFCADCGKPLRPSEAKAVTGAPRPVASADVGPACEHCGYGPLAGGLPFCPSCGTKVAVAAAEPAAPARTSMFTAKRADAGGTLVLLDDAGQPASKHPLVGAETNIGRADADVAFLDDPFLSPLHAQIGIREGRYYARDLGSKNGTWVFLEGPHRLQDADLLLVGSQVLKFRRLGYPGPNPPEADATRRLGSLIPSADIASLTQLRADGSPRDTMHLSPGRDVKLGREHGDWVFPYDPSMSGRHCVIRSVDADFVVEDDGSRNGVALGVRGEVEIKNKSRILVGDKMLRLETT